MHDNTKIIIMIVLFVAAITCSVFVSVPITDCSKAPNFETIDGRAWHVNQDGYRYVIEKPEDYKGCIVK